MAGVAALGTSGCYHSHHMAVTRCRQDLDLLVPTGGTSVGNRAVGGTGGIHCHGLVTVSQRRQDLDLLVTATRTGIGHRTIGGTGSRHHIGGIGSLAGGADMQSIAAGGTGSLDDLLLISVTGGCIFFVIAEVLPRFIK